VNPDPDRLAADWAALSAFRDPDQPGWTRRPFTSEYRAARAWLTSRMADAGLQVDVDAGGNLVGRRIGSHPSLPKLLLGSHSDTVVGGGRFDGMVGVLAAIEVGRCLAGTNLRRTLEIVDFLAEEPTDFGISTIGSRSMAGALSADMLALRSGDMSLADAIASMGGRPDAIGAARTDVGLYLELHIEQGPVLENAGLHLGVVTAITGIARCHVRVTGRADHAGTMPMAQRRDALAAASEMVLGVERLWHDGAGVGTVGRLSVSPNATNVVPGSVELWAEMRSVQAEALRQRYATFVQTAQAIGRDRNLAVALTPVSDEPPVPIPADVQTVLADVVAALGHEPRRLPSYAGHDANQLAKIAPIGMLFIPSHDGRSHCPEEWTDLSDVALGAHALGGAVTKFDVAVSS
jgi:N-carbamoyl-L-amino-acid hydrolase